MVKVRRNDWLDEDPDRDKDEAPSRRDLIVAEFEHGDWIAIREGQERVVLWDHETLTAAMEWDDAAEFAGWVAESAG